MMNDAEKYILECIQTNKKVSGKKLKSYGLPYDFETIYRLQYPDNRGVCKICRKTTSFISLQKGYRDFCSRECWNQNLSNTNSRKNSIRNKEATKKKLRNIKPTLLLIKEEYLKGTSTIKTLSEKYSISYYAIRKFLINEGVIDSDRAKKIRSKNLSNQFESINDKLSNTIWVHEKISCGWKSEDFAKALGCSKNYVCSYLRELDNALPRNSISSQEYLLRNYLDEMQIVYQSNTRSVISPQELDIFIPDYSLAIEVNGVYWHSENKKDKNYHLNKYKACKEKGIRLLNFYDTEINCYLDKVKSIVSSSVGISERVFARKCQVIELSSREYTQFMNTNHIQNSVNSSIRYGLICDNTLVAAIGFAKSRYNKNYDFELMRYANKLNYNVIGGSSKLFSHFKKEYPKSSVISYCQNRLFTGNMYSKIGMIKTHETPPNYFWINKSGKVLSRYQTQKHMLNTSLSEKDHMESNGYHRIWDCGQSVWVYQPIISATGSE